MRNMTWLSFIGDILDHDNDTTTDVISRIISKPIF